MSETSNILGSAMSGNRKRAFYHGSTCNSRGVTLLEATSWREGTDKEFPVPTLAVKCCLQVADGSESWQAAS